MKVINFTQGTDEWLEWRKNGVGGSDIPIIMEVSPYKTPYELWEEKCGFTENKVDNMAIQHGKKYEPIARSWTNQNQNLHLVPICVEDKENPFFKASLDGWDFDEKTLCEIKCPISEKKIDSARSTCAIPKDWFYQMQWNMMLTDAIRSFFSIWDYRTQQCISIEVYKDPYAQKEMREKAEKFWRGVQIGKPPELQTKDFIKIETEESKELFTEYDKILNLEKELSSKKKELRDKIIEIGNNRNFISYGFRVKSSTPKITYDIEKMKKDGIDLDNYMKKSNSNYFVISKLKKTYKKMPLKVLC